VAKRNTRRSSGVLVLSIQPIHAERIFHGVKHFELRKAVPQRRFRRVYLYETGGVGIVGCFDTSLVLRLPIRNLWAAVGDNATSKERFFSYFGKRQRGCAIPIKKPLRFPQPVLLGEIRKSDSRFLIPISSRLIRRGTKLFRLLEATRRKYIKPRVAHLRRIRKSEHAKYINLVTREIAPKYDDISKEFAVNILRSERLGYDPNGILTVRKEVMGIENAKNVLIGFTTFTHKLGGSVKTGPTVLFPGKRKLGWGSAARRAIAEKAKSEGIRKLYCTCPDWDVSVVTYLLRAGYKIEAHLTRHYTPRNGELIFGLQLANHTRVIGPDYPSRSEIVAKPSAASNFGKVEIISTFKRLFSNTWARVSAVTASQMIGGYFRGSKRMTYEEKPIALLAMATRTRVVGLLLLVPKRGGAVKALLMSETAHRDSLHGLLVLAEDVVRRAGRRKLYFLHPIADNEIISLFLSHGYVAEGVLRSPYRQGQDAAVYSRFFT
jgi:predicted transcriptional regulator